MAKRGRKSLAELMVVKNDDDDGVEIMQRPNPPMELSEEEAGVWRDTVIDHPPDWFTSATFPLLAAYCRHTIYSRRVAELIEDASRQDPFKIVPLDIATLDKLLKMAGRESSIMATLATKMRISQQSTVTAKERQKRIGKRPWEFKE